MGFLLVDKKITIPLSESGATFLGEWHATLNSPITPGDVAAKTKRKFWWKCSLCAYEWQARVEARWRQGCPACGKRKNIENRRKNWLRQSGSLESLYPALTAEWHPDNKFSPSELTPNSSEKIKWVCVNNHCWQSSVNNRVRSGKGCPYCSGARLTGSGLTSLLKSEFAAQLNPDVDLEALSEGSKKKVWWRCNEGHTWMASVASRSRRGSGCPYCAGQRATPDNNLSIKNPQLLAEWDYQENGEITPDSLLSGSGKKVWWKCKSEHSWRATIASRVGGTGCPYCANKAVSSTNNLLTKFPALALSWHPTKNLPLTSDKVTFGSGKKVWWICGKGHEWRAIVATRSMYGSGCPLCKPQTSKVELRVLWECRKIFNSVDWRVDILGSECDVVLPHLRVCIEIDGYPWHRDKLEKDKQKTAKFEKAGFKVVRLRDLELPEILGECVMFDNKKSLHEPIRQLVQKVFDLGKPSVDECSRIHEYMKSRYFWGEDEFLAALAAIDLSGREASFSDDRPELLREWDSDRNAPKDPKFFSSGSMERVWWVCDEGHSWQASIKNRTRLGTGCPYCVNVKVAEASSLLKLYPELASEYSERNPKRAQEISPGSSLKVLWKCKTCKHEFVARPADRVGKGSGCPACTGRVATNKTSLGQLFPRLMAEWDYEKNNDIDPNKLTPGSHKRVSWKCSRGHMWEAVVRVRALRAMGKCPECRAIEKK